MTLAAIFLVNAALAFALSLVLAALLGPDAFGRYAIGLSIAVVINTALFEWMRLSTTRFYGERTRREAPDVRATLDAAYWATGLVLGAVAGLAVAAGPEFGLSRPLLAAAAFCGLAYGFCEYRMALARALFLERPYILLSFLRALLGFGLAAGAAFLTREPFLVLLGAGAAALLPILAVRGSLAEPAREGRRFSRERLRVFARYALPLVAASALYQLTPLLNRAILAGRDGFTEAGYFSLVSELATRLFQNLGAALDLVLFQLAVRAEERSGRAEAERQITRNAATVSAIVIPSAAGLWLVWPAFEAVFVPDAFRGHLDGTVPLLVPALACYALVQYALNPFFQLRHRTAPVVAAAAAALAADLAIVFAWPGLGGATGFAAAQVTGLGIGLAVLVGIATASGARLPWRDLAVAAGGAAVMAVTLLPTRGLLPPLPTLALQVTGGAALYAVVAVVFDLAGCRALLRGGCPRPSAA